MLLLLFCFVLFYERFENAADTTGRLSLDVGPSPPPMIEFLELHACSVRIKGRHALEWGTCSYSNTEQQYSIDCRYNYESLGKTEDKRWFEVSVRYMVTLEQVAW